MKKYILLLTSAGLLVFGCKKTTKNTFTPTDVTGTTVLKGTITKNVITPNGNGGWTSSARVSAQGIHVSVTVSKSSLYPNSSAQGADVYNAVTDANGNYNMTVKTNAGGVDAKITVDGYSATLDTIINGTLKTGLQYNYVGTNDQRTLIMGQNSQLDYNLTGSYANNVPGSLHTGTAMITGFVGVSLIKEALAGTLIVNSTTVYALPDTKVFMNFNNDAKSFTTGYYETTTDASGNYTFVVNTVNSGVTGFPQNGQIWVNDIATTRDTLKLNNTIKTGKAGVFKSVTQNQNAVFIGNIRNATNLTYTNFVSN